MNQHWPIHARKKCIRMEPQYQQPRRRIRRGCQLFYCHPRRRVNLTTIEMEQLILLVEQLRVKVDLLRQISHFQHIQHIQHIHPIVKNLQQFIDRLHLPPSRLKPVKTSLQQLLDLMSQGYMSLANQSSALQNMLDALLHFALHGTNNHKQITAHIHAIQLFLFHIDVKMAASAFDIRSGVGPVGAVVTTGPVGPTGASGFIGSLSVQ